jgi:hypothetical protein
MDVIWRHYTEQTAHARPSSDERCDLSFLWPEFYNRGGTNSPEPFTILALLQGSFRYNDRPL